jgi:hypothetical protein
MQLPPARGDLEGALARLGEASFVVYAMLDNRVAIWALNRNGIDFQWAPTTAAKAEDAADRFARECSDPKSSAATIERSGRELYSWLVTPVRSRLPARGTLVTGNVADTICAHAASSDLVVMGLRGERRSDSRAGGSGPSGWRAQSTRVPQGSLRSRRSEDGSDGARFSAAKILTGPSATLAAILRELPGRTCSTSPVTGSIMSKAARCCWRRAEPGPGICSARVFHVESRFASVLPAGGFRHALRARASAGETHRREVCCERS